MSILPTSAAVRQTVLLAPPTWDRVVLSTRPDLELKLVRVVSPVPGTKATSKDSLTMASRVEAIMDNLVTTRNRMGPGIAKVTTIDNQVVMAIRRALLEASQMVLTLYSLVTMVIKATMVATQVAS